MKTLLPSGWPRPRGYANGVTARGRLVFVAGMIGWDGDGVFHTDDMAGQVRQALQNVVEVLKVGDAKRPIPASRTLAEFRLVSPPGDSLL